MAVGGTDPAQATETTLATFNTPGPNCWTVGWSGGNHGDLNELGGGGGGSGFISGAALKGWFPGGTHGGDGLVVITTP